MTGRPPGPNLAATRRADRPTRDCLRAFDDVISLGSKQRDPAERVAAHMRCSEFLIFQMALGAPAPSASLRGTRLGGYSVVGALDRNTLAFDRALNRRPLLHPVEQCSPFWAFLANVELEPPRPGEERKRLMSAIE